ncbi:MAG: hypothetical protein JSU69_05500 [Candidatus Zixiibacteriota bacterium]|nr:MAG: hypothetical protein JSU69_05500 [candidate division Zixibacteria bacterium]
MKRLLVFALSGLLIMAFIFGCGKQEEPQTEPAVEEAPEPAAVDTTMEDTMEVMDTTMIESTESEPGGN